MSERPINCWEFNNCGLEPGGLNCERGICPAAIETRLDGVHRGKNGGRSCWVVPKTLCARGRIYGDIHQKFADCLACPFYKKVLSEEGREFLPLQELIAKISRPRQAGPGGSTGSGGSSYKCSAQRGALRTTT